MWHLREAWKWLPLLFFIGFVPVTVAMMQGQDSLITLVLLSAALVNLESDNDLAAGFLAGLAAYKFQLLLPIAVLFFLWRNWRFVSGICISAGMAVAASAWIVGLANLLGYPGYVREASVKFASLMPVARMPNFRGIVSLFHFSPRLSVACVSVLSVAILAIAAWYGRRLAVRWQFSMAITAATLVGYHVMTHDLAILLIPMAIILSQRNIRGLWSITAVWLSTGLCFFAHDPLVALAVLALFVIQVKGSQREFKTRPPAEPTKGYNRPVQVSC